MFISFARKRLKLFRRTGFKPVLVLTLVLFFSLPLRAQQDTVLSVYTGQTEIKAGRSITLKSGFTIPSGKNVRIYIAQYNPLLSGTPSSGQNYISIRIFKDSAVTELNINAPRTVSGVN